MKPANSRAARTMTGMTVEASTVSNELCGPRERDASSLLIPTTKLFDFPPSSPSLSLAFELVSGVVPSFDSPYADVLAEEEEEAVGEERVEEPVARE